jgi:hypothetical protein
MCWLPSNMSRLWGSSYGTLSQTYGQDDFRPVEDVDEVVPGSLLLTMHKQFQNSRHSLFYMELKTPRI